MKKRMDAMKVTVRVAGMVEKGAETVAVGVYEKTTDVGGLEGIEAMTDGALGRLLGLGDFKGKVGSVGVYPGGGKVKRIVLVGLGKKDAVDVEAIRWAGASVVRAARGVKVGRVELQLAPLPEGISEQAVGQAVGEGAVLGGFVYDEFKKNAAENGGGAGTVELVLVEGVAGRRKAMADGLRVGAIIGGAANYARELSCKPGNVMTPTAVIAEAKAFGKRMGLRVKVIEWDEARKLGMGGLVAVGQGSEHRPGVVVIEYRGGKAKGETIAVVGKAITFDTGGISIKPAADMDAMKYDKCGGMAVLGIMQAAKELGVKQNVIGVLAVAENAVGGAAYRPGDILRMYNGKTVEITNTDAEGRLVLADAMAYVGEAYKPGVMIDMATLTGGVVVALGGVYGGLMSNDDGLAGELVVAGKVSGDWLWHMPLHERYKSLLDGTHADLVNSGGREAHVAQGGMFLQNFVPAGVKWAHLDIAGVAHPKKDDRYLGKGATGFGVRAVVEWLSRR